MPMLLLICVKVLSIINFARNSIQYPRQYNVDCGAIMLENIWNLRF